MPWCRPVRASNGVASDATRCVAGFTRVASTDSCAYDPAISGEAVQGSGLDTIKWADHSTVGPGLSGLRKRSSAPTEHGRMPRCPAAGSTTGKLEPLLDDLGSGRQSRGHAGPRLPCLKHPSEELRSTTRREISVLVNVRSAPGFAKASATSASSERSQLEPNPVGSNLTAIGEPVST